MRLAAALAAICCLGLAAVPGAGAQGRVDRSYGSDGVVDLGAGLVGKRWLGDVAVAPDGGAFVAENRDVCSRGGCPYNSWLKRYRPDGSLDRSFDPGTAPVATGTSYGAGLTVDSKGRPILSWNGARRRVVVVRRLRRDGRVDRGFGRAGTFVLDCDCYGASVAARPGGGLLIVAGHELKKKGRSYSSYYGTEWVFAQLRSDGSFDPRFGRGGIARMRMVGLSTPVATPAPAGSAVLAGEECCSERYPSLPFVGRLLPRGGLDRRFTATAKRSLRGAPGTRLEDYGWNQVTPIFRSRGRIDFYVPTRAQIVAFRLRRDGSLVRSFGHRGYRLIPLQYGDIAPDGAGGAFVVGYRAGGYQVRRVGPGGRPDRAFGRLPLKGAYNEEGLAIFAAGRGRAIVLARDESICRQVCPSDPKLYRVVRGS